MGIDWETLLGAEGAALEPAYEEYVYESTQAFERALERLDLDDGYNDQ